MHRARAPLRLLGTASLVLVLSPLTLAPTAQSPAAAAPPPSTATVDRDPTVTRRVVWDASGLKGPQTLIYSAERDGSDRRLVYRRQRGWILDLTLDRTGRWVAFTPFAGRSRPASLVVADVLTGKHRDVLARNRRVDFVGGIGWSPNGRRLVFEGTFGEGDARATWLWTVRRDGTGLKRLHVLRPPRPQPEHPLPEQVIINSEIIWTAGGIFYTGERGVMRLRRGATRLLVPDGYLQHLSGNGRWIFVTGGGVNRTVTWRVRANGRGLRRLAAWRSPHPGLGHTMGSVPDHAGRSLLTVASGPFSDVPKYEQSPSRAVVHPAGRAPRVSDPTLPFLEGVSVLDWN